MTLPALQPMTVEQFLDWESGDNRRYELVNGAPVAMAAPSWAHQIIAANFTRRLAETLDEHPPCHALVEAPVALPDRDDICHLADVAVVCQPHQKGQRLPPEPVLVIEILSPSTESHDRRVKVPDYRAIPSVQEIVLVDQNYHYCEIHRRLDDGRWLTDLVRFPDARLRLESVGLDLPLAALYANVEVEESGRIVGSGIPGSK